MILQCTRMLKYRILAPIVCNLDFVYKAQEVSDIVSILYKISLTKPVNRQNCECCTWKMMNTVNNTLFADAGEESFQQWYTPSSDCCKSISQGGFAENYRQLSGANDTGTACASWLNFSHEGNSLSYLLFFSFVSLFYIISVHVYYEYVRTFLLMSIFPH
jgi:hypothetical protein